MSRLIKCSIRPFALVAALSLFSANASAIGVGFSGSIEGGEGEWEEEISGPDAEYEGNTSRSSLGIVFDTEVGRQGVFNYRLNLQVQGFEADFELDGTTIEDELDLRGIVADNTFGFKLYADETTRIWVGPRVRIGVFDGDLQSDSSVDVTLAEFGVGGVFGADFNVGPTVTFGVEAGFIASGYGGEIEDSFGENDLTGDSVDVFLTGLVLFRLGGR